jgi:tetratricopeptide (TPR) repeat protein
MRKGDYDEAVALHERAISLAEVRAHPGDWLVLRRAYNNLGVIHHTRGDLEAAVTFMERGLAIGLEERNLPWIGRTRFSVGFYYLWKGDIEKATEIYRHVADPAEHADPDSAANAATQLLWLKGDWERAYESAREDLELARRAQDLQSQLSILAALTRNAIELSRLDDAARWADDALAIYAAQGGFSINAAAVNPSAMALAMVGRIEEARDLVQRATEYAQRRGAVFGRPYRALSRAVIAVAAGDLGEARTAHEESHAHFSRMGMVEEAAAGQFILVRAILLRKDEGMRPWAHDLLREARATFKQIGFGRYVQEIDRLLAEAKD